MPHKRTIPRVCRRCGADFLANAYKVSIGKALYCRPSCLFTSQRDERSDVEIRPDGTARIALCANDGTVVAYAIIDAADAEWASQWRWCLTDGYAVRGARIGGRRRSIRLHREILDLPRISDGRDGDHIDRDRLNNRRVNLRILPRGGNNQNKRSQLGASSKHRGVTWDAGNKKWRAQVEVQGKNVYLGLFSDEQAAADTALKARQRLLPFSVD